MLDCMDYMDCMCVAVEDGRRRMVIVERVAVVRKGIAFVEDAVAVFVDRDVVAEDHVDRD